MTRGTDRSTATKYRQRAGVLRHLADVKRGLAAAHLQQADTMDADANRFIARAEALEAL